MKLGILADTHNVLDPRLEEVFAGVDHILHAGDVCRPILIAELEVIAPVTVVAGNNDFHPGWRETEVCELGGRRFLVEHIVHPREPSAAFRGRLARMVPDAVIFGHTHRPYCETHDGVLYLNPGSAGAARFGLPRSVCRLEIREGRLVPEFVTLPS